MAERLLLRRPVPLAVLLTLHLDDVPARHAAARRLVVEPVAGVPDPVGAGRLPRHLLLLPEGLLSLVLRLATRMRRQGLVEDVRRRNEVPVRAAEHPPLLLLALAADPRVPLVRRDPR